MHKQSRLAEGRASSLALALKLAATRERFILLLLTAAAFAALSVPVLVAAIPPLLDYPNHLVRLWLITGGAEHAPVSLMYEVSWSSATTNVGIDYLGAVLGLFVPVLPLGSFLVLLAIVLPPLGALCLNRAMFGTVHWFQIGFLVFAFGSTLLAGLLNFRIGVGLALLAASLEPRLAHTSLVRRSGARLIMAVLLLIVHVFALFFYCALLAAIAFGPHLSALATRRGLADRAGAILAAAGVAAIPGIVFIVLAPSLPGAHVDAAANAPVWDFSFWNKKNILLGPIATYALEFDLVCVAAIVAALVWAVAARRLELHAGLLLASAALWVLAVLAPTAMAGTWWIDNRIPIMAVLALLAGLRPELDLAPLGRLAMAGLLAAVVTTRSGWIAYVWAERQADVAAVQRAAQAIPPGSAVLPLENVDYSVPLETQGHPVGRYFHNGHPTHMSLPVLVIMWQQAFLPNLFCAVGKQPCQYLPPWDEISFSDDGVYPSQILTETQHMPAYYRTWRQRYDYVLLINADFGKGADPAALPELRLVRDEGFARLYRIVKATEGQ